MGGIEWDEGPDIGGPTDLTGNPIAPKFIANTAGIAECRKSLQMFRNGRRARRDREASISKGTGSAMTDDTVTALPRK